MPGFGISPCALAPFGGAIGPDGSTTTAPTDPPVVPPTCLSIVNGDFVMLTNGSLEGDADPVDQAATFLLSTVLGTFCDPGKGSTIRSITIYNSMSIVETQDAVARALKPLLDDGSIDSLEVTVSPVVATGNATNSFTVTYRKTGVIQV